MKQQIENLLKENREKLKLGGSKMGLRLSWVNRENYSVYYKGMKYTPDKPEEYETFIKNILRGKEPINEERIRKMFKKQKAKMEAKVAAKKAKKEEEKKEKKELPPKPEVKKEEIKKGVEKLEEIVKEEPKKVTPKK